MGDVVNLNDFRKTQSELSADIADSGLVPLEFATGITDRRACFDKLAKYSIDTVHVRTAGSQSNSLIYLIGVKNAIRLNKLILEHEDISDDEIEQRIDLIQLMENMNFNVMESLVESYSARGSLLS